MDAAAALSRVGLRGGVGGDVRGFGGPAGVAGALGPVPGVAPFAVGGAVPAAGGVGVMGGAYTGLFSAVPPQPQAHVELQQPRRQRQPRGARAGPAAGASPLLQEAAAAAGVAVQGGEAFVAEFYKRLDGLRDEIGIFYRESSVLVWCGEHIKGQRLIATFLRALPRSQHTVDSLDCHPVPIPHVGQSPVIAVLVAGYVRFRGGGRGGAAGVGAAGSREGTPFSQAFVLTQDAVPTGGTYFVASDCYRLGGTAALR